MQQTDVRYLGFVSERWGFFFERFHLLFFSIKIDLIFKRFLTD